MGAELRLPALLLALSLFLPLPADAKTVRSQHMRRAFLRAHHLKHVPKGYEIDHAIPLWKGGRDDPSNMQILTIYQHRLKTAREAGERALIEKRKGHPLGAFGCPSASTGSGESTQGGPLADSPSEADHVSPQAP